MQNKKILPVRLSFPNVDDKDRIGIHRLVLGRLMGAFLSLFPSPIARHSATDMSRCSLTYKSHDCLYVSP
jgi:hypothetical protein